MARGRNDQRAGPKRYRFGNEYELAPKARELRRAGQLVHIQPKPFDVLFYLLCHRERVVPRDELLAAVWSDVVVNTEALTYALHAARRALGDDGARQRVIQTIPRCGFRFVAPVQELEQEDGEPHPTARTGEAPPAAGQRLRFVGRATIFSQFASVLDEVIAGRGRTVLLSGEAGIGKTRTAEELAEVAKRRGCRVLVGRCIEGEGSPAFWPWVQVIRSFAREEVPTSLLETLREGALEIARMVPELRKEIPDLPAVAQVDPKAARFLLFDGIATFLRRAAEVRPLALIFDDLHRADEPSLLLMQFLATEIDRIPLLMIGTYREAELRADGMRREPVASVARQESAATLGLEGLARTEVAELIAAASDRIPSSEAVEDLYELTGGNPFFLRQILQVLESEGRLGCVESGERISITLPRRIQDLIAQQLESLPLDCREILRVAAVLGRDFQLAALELAVHSNHGEVLQALSPSIAAGVVTEHETRTAVYRFAHVLIRDALYQSLEEARRVELHARVGAALESLWGESLGPHCAALAHHFFQAVHLGTGERAILYATKAGEWASERAAFEEAPRHYEHALEALDLLAPHDEARRCALLLALGDAQTKAGNRDNARRTLEAAARIAKKAGLPEKLAAAALRFAPDFLAIETGVYDPELVALLEEALAALSSADSALRARLLARLAVALHWANDSEAKRERLCQEALEVAERVGEPETLAYVRSGRKLALYSLANPECYLNADPGGPLAPGDEPIALVLQLLRMTSLLILGRVSEFDTEIETFTALAKKLNQPQCLWYPRLLRSMRLQMEGRYDEAAIWSRRALASGQRVNDKNALHSFMVHLVISSIDIGQPEQLLLRTRRMVERFPRVVAWRAGLAMIYSEMSMVSEAEEQTEWLLRADVLARPQRSEWFGTMGSLVFAADFLKRYELCKSIYTLLIPHANQLAVIGYCSFCWGSIRHWLGILSRSLGRLEEAEEHFRSAMSVNLKVGARPWLARTQFDYAKLLMSRDKDHGRARTYLEKSEALARALGMSRLLKRIQLERRK